MRKRLLLDVDEVIADFASPFFQAVHATLGRKVGEEDFPDWQLFDIFAEEEREAIVAHLQQPGFCRNFPVRPGAKEAIAEILTFMDVTPVTRPFPASTWVHDRALWLKEHFDFEADEIVNTGAKHLVKGDAFLDDHPKNVLAWQAAHPTSLAMLQHNFTTARETQHDHLRVRTWDEVIEKLRALVY